MDFEEERNRMTLGMNKLIEEYTQKTEKRRRLEGEARKLATELSVMEQELIDGFARDGIQSIKTALGPTIYLNREIYAKMVGDPTEGKEALKEAGLADFVKETISPQTLRAYVREMDEVLPEGLRPYVEIAEVFRMRMRSN